MEVWNEARESVDGQLSGLCSPLPAKRAKRRQTPGRMAGFCASSCHRPLQAQGFEFVADAITPLGFRGGVKTQEGEDEDGGGQFLNFSAPPWAYFRAAQYCPLFLTHR